jgi:nitrate reductase molybdenum cofactor assembly chaperone NarJ/NarW
MNAALFQAAAICLEYPDESLVDLLPALRGVQPLAEFVQHVERTPLAQLQADYVDTFDLRRRCSLYLSYFTFGDTRKRGVALLHYSSAYRAAGFVVTSGELPDHLAVVCEFAARCPEQGRKLLQQSRAGLEVLALALRDAASPYVHVVDAVRAVLPAAAPDDLEAALDLARTGPPMEEVGVESAPRNRLALDAPRFREVSG